ncbi:uncharacterized protein LOC135490005 [Lineus longissimus]|uniref:uncharacterized protein LOC135490005 n=1 Tax=Lineus longissimus TaxID=88925 RepID=UPI00315D7163
MPIYNLVIAKAITWRDREKLKYIDGYRNQQRCVRLYSEEHNIKKATFLSWLRKEETIRHNFDHSKKRGQERKVKDRDVGYWPEMEVEMSEWFRDKRQIGMPVSIEDLKERAMIEFQQWWDQLPEETQADITKHFPAESDERYQGPYLQSPRNFSTTLIFCLTVSEQ